MRATVYENRAEWLVPAALIVLSAVPAIAGAVRIARDGTVQTLEQTTSPSYS